MGKFNVGDRVRVVARKAGIPHDYEIGHIGEIKFVYEDGSGYDLGEWACRDDELEFANDSPTRTVTRREIVPGVYGEVTVERIPFSGFEISYSSYGNAHKLRAAARIFNEIADVLDEQSAEAQKEAA